MQRIALTVLKIGSYLFRTSLTSLTMSPPPLPGYFLHLCLVLAFFLTSVTSSLLSTSHDSLLPSLMVLLPLVLLPSCCRKHASTLTFSSFLSTSLTLSLLLSFSHSPSRSLVFISPFLSVTVSLPLSPCMLEIGMWVPPCLRSWGGLSLEKYQSNKYLLTVNRSHCKAEWFNKTARPGKTGFFLHSECKGGLLAQIRRTYTDFRPNLNITPISKVLYVHHCYHWQL